MKFFKTLYEDIVFYFKTKQLARKKMKQAKKNNPYIY